MEPGLRWYGAERGNRVQQGGPFQSGVWRIVCQVDVAQAMQPTQRALQFRHSHEQQPQESAAVGRPKI